MAQSELLAIDGGAPLLPEGPPAWPGANEQVRAALESAYADGSWGKYHAGHVERLEAELAAMHGVAHALTCASGTFAVELALRSLKIQPGDEVVMAGYDFGGNFRAVEAVGACPVLVDIEPGTWCLDVAQVAAALSDATTAVIASHLHGGMADLRNLRAICQSKGVAIVEDACQTPGGEAQGRVAGSQGDVGVVSFGGSKLLTAGRGGAILTHDPQVAQRAKIYCERGNHAFPLSELQAAILLPQLVQLPAANKQRQANAAELIRQTHDLAGLLGLTQDRERGVSSYYKVGWQWRGEHPRWRTREALLRALQAEGIGIDVGFRGFLGRSAARCRRVSELPHCRAAAERTILLHHPVLLEPPQTIARVGKAIRRVVEPVE